MLKVSLVLEGLKFQGDISKSTRVTLDFIRLKGKMSPAAIETVVSYLEQNTEKLRDVSITSLADAVRWADRLLGDFNIVTGPHTHKASKTETSSMLHAGPSCMH